MHQSLFKTALLCTALLYYSSIYISLKHFFHCLIVRYLCLCFPSPRLQHWRCFLSMALTYGASGAGLLGDLPLVRSGPGYLIHESRGAEIHGDGRLWRGPMRWAVLGDVVVVIAAAAATAGGTASTASTTVVGSDGPRLDGGASCPWALSGGQEWTHGARVRVGATGGRRPEGWQFLVRVQHRGGGLCATERKSEPGREKDRKIER